MQGFSVEIISDRVARDLEDLPFKIKVSMFRVFDLLEKYGNEVREPHTKALGDGLYEARAKGVEGIARAFLLLEISGLSSFCTALSKSLKKHPKTKYKKREIS